MTFQCPNCAAELSSDLVAEVPEETDLTISLNITPGQFCMAKTVAGVLENFAALQIEIGRSLGCETNVFVVGLSYENDCISITTRIVNSPAQGIEAGTGETEGLDTKCESPVPEGNAP